jgi:hypothetical protein
MTLVWLCKLTILETDSEMEFRTMKGGRRDIHSKMFNMRDKVQFYCSLNI